jgi:hypothetical protein
MHEILFLANLHRRKGIFDLLQAFDRVAVRFPTARNLRSPATGSELAKRKRAASAICVGPS